jgi:hypothetical protein
MMMSSPTLIYDLLNPSAVAEILTHHVDAFEFLSRAPARFSLTLGTGTLDPARSGPNRIFRW